MSIYTQTVISSGQNVLDFYITTTRLMNSPAMRMGLAMTLDRHHMLDRNMQNLRAEMYGIAVSDRYSIKRVAGKIIPAIATTTATVAGLVTIELFKVLRGARFDDYKNSFLSLALPVIVLTEPGRAKVTTIREGLSFTLWDKMKVYSTPKLTMEQFITEVRKTVDFDVDMVLQGSRILYSSFLPTHRKHLTASMSSLVKKEGEKQYVDLTVCFSGLADDVSMNVPPVRFYLPQNRMKSQAHQLRLFPSLTDISMEPESSSSEYNKLDKLSRIIGERLANYNSSFSDSPLTHRHSIEGVSIAQAKYSSLCDHLPHTAYPFTETESLLSQRELRLIQSRPHTILEPHAIKECTISSRESAPAILRSPMQTWPPTRRGTSEPLTGLCLHHSDIDIEGIPEQSDRDELCERAANGGILSKEDLDSKISPRNNEGQNRAQDYRSNEKVWVQLSSTEPKRQSTEAETPHLGYTVSTERREQLPDLFPIDEEKTKIQRKDINQCNKIAHSLASTSELKPRLLDHVGENAHSSRPPDDSESWATVDSGDDDSSEGSIYFSCKTELPDSMLTEVGIELCVEKRDYVELMWLPMPGETLSACVGISDVPSVCVRFPHLSIVNCSQKTANKKTV